MASLINTTGKEVLLPRITSAYRESLFDADGREYFDLEAGVWCLSLGHNHECTRDVFAGKARDLQHSGYIYASGASEIAADRVCRFAGLPNGACLFLSSGSEAIEFALQVVAAIGQPGDLLTLPKAYLGSYSRTTERGEGWSELPWSMTEFNAMGAKLPTRTSAFLFEPGSAGGEVRFPEVDYVRHIVGEVRKQGGLIMVNEVTTGAGRTGRNCAYQHSGITPDIVVMGKGIGNGYPVSAIVLSQTAAAKLHASPLRYMQSHQNDPLGARIADRVIEVIENEKLANRAAIVGQDLLDRLKELECNEAVKEVRGKGFMIAIEFRTAENCASIHAALLNAGFVTTNRGTMIRLDPPLNTKSDTLNRFVECLSGLLHNA